MNLIKVFEEFGMTNRGAKGYKTRVLKTLELPNNEDGIVTDEEFEVIIAHMSSSNGKYANIAKTKLKEIRVGESFNKDDKKTYKKFPFLSLVWSEADGIAGWVEEDLGSSCLVGVKYEANLRYMSIEKVKLKQVTREEQRRLAGFESIQPIVKKVIEKGNRIEWKCKREKGKFDIKDIESFAKEHGLNPKSVQKCIDGLMKTHKQFTFTRK